MRITLANGQDCVEQNGVSVTYRWCHSRRRTIGITVRQDKSVSVRAPLRTPFADIRNFVVRHIDWIEKIRRKLDSRSSKAEQNYTNGSLFLFQGKSFKLLAEEGSEDRIRLLDETLMIRTPDHSEVKIMRMIELWYREQAGVIFATRAIECHRLMQCENIPLPRIIIRLMKSRWGSYSYRTKRINLNLNLIKTEQSCLDYVIIHELCHIKIRHHGPEFWEMVGRYVPNYPELRKKLRMFA